MEDVNVVEMRAMIGRWESVREDWQLSEEEASEFLWGPFSGPISDPASWSAPDSERRMRLAIDLSLVLGQAFQDPNRVRSWLRTPMEAMRGNTPLGLMADRADNIRYLRDLISSVTP